MLALQWSSPRVGNLLLWSRTRLFCASAVAPWNIFFSLRLGLVISIWNNCRGLIAFQFISFSGTIKDGVVNCNFHSIYNFLSLQSRQPRVSVTVLKEQCNAPGSSRMSLDVVNVIVKVVDPWSRNICSLWIVPSNIPFCLVFSFAGLSMFDN